MARRRTFSPRISGPRRETKWFDIPPTRVTLAAADTANLLLVLTTAEKANRPFTIVRTRLVFQIVTDQDAADENYGCALGLAVVSDQATAIGVTAIPTPNTDRASDLWFLFEDLVASFGFGDATGFINDGASKYVDSKAMRKVEDGSDIAVVVESHNNSQGLLAFVAGRMLIKMH